MSAAEVITYGVLIGAVFLGGTGFWVRAIARSTRGRRFAVVASLLGWIAAPLVLAMVALSAMMSPTGGDPVISILRAIAIGYIIGGAVVIGTVVRFDRK